MWYLYENPPQSGPENLIAESGSGQVFLDWDPISNPLASNISSISTQFGSDQYIRLNGTDKKEMTNANRHQREITRTNSLGNEQTIPSWVQRTDRDANIYVTLYDTYGDGYDSTGHIMSESGEEIAILSSEEWGSEITYGPIFLSDGVYVIYFDESTWMEETTWEISDENGIIASGNVYSPVYFSIGDFNPPVAELVIDSLWYDTDADVIQVEVSNNGTAETGWFLFPTIF